MKPRNIRVALACIVPLLALLLVPQNARATLRVVTSIETLADLARQVGGDKVRVESLSRGYMDPHFVEPKPSLVVALNRADLLLHVGLELEIGWLPPLVTNSRNPKVQPGSAGNLDCSTAIQVLDTAQGKVDRSMGDIHPSGNPHYWIPPGNGLRLAKAIAERLKSLDGANGGYYDQRLVAFASQLKARAPAWEQAAARLRGTRVVTYHKSWTYVAQWLGLIEEGYVEPKPGIPPSPRYLAGLIQRIRANHVKLLIMENFYNRSVAKSVADASGIRLVALPSDVGSRPDIRSYVDLVDALLKELGASL